MPATDFSIDHIIKYSIGYSTQCSIACAGTDPVEAHRCAATEHSIEHSIKHSIEHSIERSIEISSEPSGECPDQTECAGSTVEEY